MARCLQESRRVLPRARSPTHFRFSVGGECDSQRTNESLAGHVSRQMLEHYSPIRSQEKQAAIRCLEVEASTAVLEETGHNTGYSREGVSGQDEANSMKRNGGPARI